ncbi:MAG TPA: efflux RND transporter periplasmic adaptor subunit [Candidatus Angelobacter sp.]|nr:efflux RND transporter periplasmic adaptor subunit [Candidatus Angelobacter sp.]
MSPRNRFFVLLGILLAGATAYYFFTTDRTSDLILVGTVDANQIVVSPKMMGKIERLAVDEGDQVKSGDTIAVLDSKELNADQQAAHALLVSLRSQVAQTRATEEQTKGETTSGVANAQARLSAARAAQAQALADLQRVQSDSKRAIALAEQGVVSEQQSVQADAQLKAQQAVVRSAEDQIKAAQADLDTAQAHTHMANAAEKTVAATQAQALNAQAQLEAAETRMGYSKVFAPVNGIVTVRAAREGEVVTIGQPIAIITDLSLTWIRAAIPETQSLHIAIGDALSVRLPSGEIIPGKVIYKAPEAEFATQRDVSRRKRDIKAIVLKVAVDNSKKTLVPGMTAEVLVPNAKVEGS